MLYKFATALTFGSIIATATAAASCYGTGITYEIDPTMDIHRACRGWDGNRGALQDIYYLPYNESPYPARVCVDQGPNSVIFEITNLRPTQGYQLNNDNCDWRLNDIARACPQGGTVQENDFLFRVDPEEGNCR